MDWFHTVIVYTVEFAEVAPPFFGAHNTQNPHHNGRRAVRHPGEPVSR